jgi:SAM-dependent methyltransferase
MGCLLAPHWKTDQHPRNTCPITMCGFDHFSFLAPYYERLIPPGSRQKLLELLALSPNLCVLDAGGGTGRVAQIVKTFVSQVVVADISLGMLRETVVKDGLHSVNTATECLPFVAESFDRIVMVDALHHVVSQIHTAQEMWRVLKPGGWIVIEEPDIRTLPVKLIALGEKLLLMRSHFLAPVQIAELFNFPHAQVNIDSERDNAWIVIKR